jgi:histidyl-tRNA synthetase
VTQNQPVKGMRDFFPDEMAKRSWLFDHFRESARRFNFSEYDSCIVESEDLYTRKTGDEIGEQMYNFQDKKGRKLALRPELTPSLARMIISRQNELTYPIRWFSIAQCFRYEKMQKGRKREHFQWNVDIVGDPSTSVEVELLALLVDFFVSVGLTEKDVTIRFSNRQILFELLLRLGCSQDQLPALCIIIDKLDKIGSEAMLSMLTQEGISPAIAEKVLSFVQSRNMEEIAVSAGYLPSAAADVEALTSAASSYGIAPFLRFTPSLVRGLSYYTGTVFEAFEATGEGRALCGGGRYDQLIELYGGRKTPMIGFGLGDVGIGLLLSEKNLIPTQDDCRILVGAFSPQQVSAATRIVRELRQHIFQQNLTYPTSV